VDIESVRIKTPQVISEIFFPSDMFTRRPIVLYIVQFQKACVGEREKCSSLIIAVDDGKCQNLIIFNCLNLNFELQSIFTV